MTPPISSAAATSQEIALNNHLIDELKAQRLFVSNEELTKRYIQFSVSILLTTDNVCWVRFNC